VETNAILQTIGNLDTVFDIGESFPYNCTDPIVTANYTNVITVTAVGITSTTAVNDSDPSAVISVIPPVTPVCSNLVISQTSSARNVTYTPTYSCTASGPTTFQVTLTDPNGNLVTDSAATS
jgi:hypothetical protein